MNSRPKKLLLLIVAAALLTANGFLLPVINRQRGALGITRLEPLENAPPMLALTTQVLGGFRGLIANALWIRSSQLQEDGKYFEMVQLADWITKLEPHIVTVWQVQAWNMAFNISVKFPDYEDRWRWVQRGIELLRDDALRYNPDQPGLYSDLAWLFQFKMGQNMDDGHVHYKLSWARDMMNVFGDYRPDFDRLINPQTDEERERARLLRTKYKMDARFMKMLHERYGPLDWRLPEAHAIYWASVGMERCKKEEDVRKLRSAVYQSMNLSFQRGQLVWTTNTLRFLPNLAIAPKVNAAYLEQLANSPPLLTNGVANAYKNFLKDVPYQFFLVNRIPEAEQWLRTLRQRFPAAVPANDTLAEYAVNRAMENAQDQSQNKVGGLIRGFVTQSYYAALEDRDDDSTALMQRARELYAAYNSRNKGSQRLAVITVDEAKREVVDALLSEQSPLPAEAKAHLRQLANRTAEAPAPRPQK